MEVQSLQYGYQRPLGTLEALSMKGPGITAVIGPNGSGKSTLLHTLAGLLPPVSGSILWEGESLEHLSIERRARHLAIVLTTPILLGGLTVKDVVRLGRFPHGNQGMELADQAMEKLGIAHLASKPMDAISDGERQKVAIARALCQDTPLLFLDEPTAFLDFASKQALMALFQEEALNRRIVFSTHDLHLLQGEEVELLVVEGKVVKCYDAEPAQQILAQHIAIHRESTP